MKLQEVYGYCKKIGKDVPYWEPTNHKLIPFYSGMIGGLYHAGDISVEDAVSLLMELEGHMNNVQGTDSYLFFRQHEFIKQEIFKDYQNRV